MQARTAGLVLACALLWLFSAPAGAVAGTNVAVDIAARSVVLVQGNEFGTGFAFLRRGTESYFITAAHLLSYDDYAQNALLRDGPAKKGPSDWLTVYDPTDGSAYSGEIVGTPDFLHDIIVFKVAGMRHRPRTLCLDTTLAPTAPFFVESFKLAVLQNPPLGSKFGDGQVSLLGGSTLAAESDGNVQFSSPLEKGNSGSPVVDADAGTGMGIVRESALSVDEHGVMRLSDDTRYAAGIDAIRSYLESLSKEDAALANLPFLKETDRSTLIPWLSGQGGNLRFVAFDEPLVVDGTTGTAGPYDPNASKQYRLAAIYKPYDTAIRNALRSAFAQSDGSAVVDRSNVVYPIQSDASVIAADDDLCRLPNGSDAVGVVGLRRELTAGPGARQLKARIGLIDCQGHIMDSTDVDAVDMDPTGPSQQQVRDFIGNLQRALAVLDGPNHDRLANFAADGLSLGDAEMRGFYRVDHDGGTWVNYSWANGASADKSKIYTKTAVLSIDGVDATQLASLSQDGLEQLIDAAGGSLAAQVVNPATNSSQQISLTSGDRCFYLRRRFEKEGNTYIDPRYLRSETL